MKKSILAVALMTAAFGLQAKDYVIFQDAALTEDQVQVPTSLYTWEGTVTATDQDGASVWAINGDAWFGGGWNIAANTFDVSVFNNTAVNLVFEYKTDFTGAFKLQFKNETKNVAKEDVAGTLTADNEWHSFSLDVVSFAPEFLKSLENGNAAYIFAPVGGNGGQGKTIAFRNVKFEVTGEPYTPPVIEHPAPHGMAAEAQHSPIMARIVSLTSIITWLPILTTLSLSIPQSRVLMNSRALIPNSISRIRRIIGRL